MGKLSEKYLESPEEIMKAFALLTREVPICFFLGIIFAVIGVIGEAANIVLGLSSTIWLLLAITSFLALIPPLVCVNNYASLHLLDMKIKD